MKKIILLLIAGCFLTVACARKLSRKELKERLEKTMADHLQQRQPSNSSHPRFDVLDVVWFEETEYYRCEFTVKMTLPEGKDTTGVMRQKVYKDFSKVE